MLFLANRKSGARDSEPIHGTRDLGPFIWDVGPETHSWDPGPETRHLELGTRDPII